jgi:hypothetical protein
MRLAHRRVERCRPGATSHKCNIIPVCRGVTTRVHRWSMSRTLGCTLICSGWSCGDRKWLLAEGPTCVACRLHFTLLYFLLQFLILCPTNRTTLTGVLHKMLIFTELINTAHRFVVCYCGHCTHINTVHPSYFLKVRLNALPRAHSSPPVGLPGGPIPSGFLYSSWHALPFCPTHAAYSAKPSPYYAPADDPDAV